MFRRRSSEKPARSDAENADRRARDAGNIVKISLSVS